MSQFGMQMPAGQFQRGPTMNVYTGLIFLAVIALLGACAFMFAQGGQLSPDGSPFSLQKGEIKFPNEK